MRKKRRRAFLVKTVPAYKHGVDSDGISNIGGEPCRMYLRRFDRDNTLRTYLWSTCCDCKLEHLLIFEVMNQDGEWWLTKRAYGYPKPEKPTRRLRRR